MRSLSRKTGVCDSLDPVCAVMWTVEISGHMTVVRVLVSAPSGWYGRKVRWTPSTCGHDCVDVSPVRETASW